MVMELSKTLNPRVGVATEKKFNSEAMAKLSDAERKTPDQYIKNDPEASRKQMEKNKDFLIKMILANAKNVDPFSEDSSKSNEMAQSMTTIAEIDAMMAQSAKMDEIVHAVKNPGFSATELQGQEIEYDDSKRYFEDLKKKVDFNYNIDFADEYKGKGNVKTTIEIVDSKGVVVYKGKGADSKGEHQFVWNGKDNDGNTVKQGFYHIKVKSEGLYTKDGIQLSFPVRSSSTLLGKVASVEIENGIATGVMLEGSKFIEKSQIKLIKDIKVPELDVKLDPAFMNNNVNFDLSKMQIKKGACEIYYNNHVKNSGMMEIKIQDSLGKLVKTIEYKIEKTAKPGINAIALKDQIKGLPDGNYTVNIAVEDLDQDSKMIALNSNFVERVAGLNYQDNKVIINGEKEISSHNVKGVTSKKYMTLVDQANILIGKKITYRDDTVRFHEGTPVSPTLEFSKTNKNNEDALLLEGVMYVYDSNNNMVQIVKGFYNPYTQLTDASKNYISNGYLQDNFGEGNYDALTLDQKIITNRHIEAEISKEPADPEIIFTNEFKDSQKAKIAKVNISWNGKFGNMRPNPAVIEAKNGEIYRMEFAPTYIRPNGETFTETFSFNENSSVVKETKIEGEVITLVLENGIEITEDLVLKVE